MSRWYSDSAEQATAKLLLHLAMINLALTIERQNEKHSLDNSWNHHESNQSKQHNANIREIFSETKTNIIPNRFLIEEIIRPKISRKTKRHGEVEGEMTMSEGAESESDKSRATFHYIFAHDSENSPTYSSCLTDNMTDAEDDLPGLRGKTLRSIFVFDEFVWIIADLTMMKTF